MPGSSKTTSFTLIAILALIWGSSFILMKRGLESFTPFEIGAIRMFVSFLCMVPFVAFEIKKRERADSEPPLINRKTIFYLAASGLLGNGIPSILFPLAETHLSSALAGMLNSLTPLFTFIVGISIFRMKISQSRLFGLLIGLIGALLLIAGRNSDNGQSNLAYASAIIIATICYGFSVNIIRNKLTHLNPIIITSGALFFAGVPMGVAMCFTEVIHKTQALPGAWLSLLYVAILGALGTALSTVLFTKLVKISGALFAASVTYLIPVIAILWGIADDEKVLPIHFVGLAGALLGVYLINKSSPVKAQ